MAVSSGPDIVDSGLVLALDAADRNSFDSNENLLTNSNISSTTWNPNSSPVLTNNSSTSPDGSVNATQIAAPATAGSGIFRTISLTLGTVYTYSVFVKAVSGSNTIYFGTDTGTTALVTVNTSTGVASLNSGSPTNITSISYPNSWYRVSFTFTASATATHSFVIYNLTASANTWLAWGAQIERGSSASPYYATISTAKTRGSTLIDLTGRGNSGTLTNGPTYSSANGGSLVFDGTNDYVTSPFTFTAGQAVTILGWLYSTASTSAYRNFVDTSSNRPMIWWNTSGQIEFDTGSGYTTPAVYRNQWVYVGLVKPSGSTIASYYVNGVFASNGGVSYSVPASTPTWFNRGGSQTWIGNCSNASIYNRALTATEIQQNFNATRSRFGI